MIDAPHRLDIAPSLPHISNISRARVFCRAMRQDASEVVAVVNSAFAVVQPYRNGPRLSFDDFYQTMTTGKGCWYVLKEFKVSTKGTRTEVISKVLATILYCSEEELQCSVHMFAVHQKFRGQEVGATLFKAVTALAYIENKERLSLWCVEKPGLVRYYNRLGLLTTGKRGLYDPTYLQADAGEIPIVEMGLPFRTRLYYVISDSKEVMARQWAVHRHAVNRRLDLGIRH